MFDSKCPLCGSRKSSPLFTTKDYAFQCTDELFSVNRCNICGCGFVNPRPEPERLKAYYPEAYYWSWEGADAPVHWQEIIEKRQCQLSAKADWLADLKPGRLLDIGAQKGEFIWFMRRLGWDVLGIEMDSSVPNPVGMPMQYGDFLSMDLTPESFDCITMWAVLEHVHNPADFIKKVERLLRPGGRLIALVTNLNSVQARIYRADDYPRHLTIFTKRSIRNICEQYGLVLNKFNTVQDIFGGSLNGGLVYIVKRIGGYSSEDAFKEWKQLKDPELFWVCWRGRPSAIIKNISRIDRFISLPVEKILDNLGYGFNLTFSVKKEDL